MAMAVNKFRRTSNNQGNNEESKPLSKAECQKMNLEKQSLLCTHCNKMGHITVKSAMQNSGNNNNMKKFAGNADFKATEENETPFDLDETKQFKMLNQIDPQIIQAYLAQRSKDYSYQGNNSLEVRTSSSHFNLTGPYN
ncbi:unnamed protein product [Cuscuta epithymum]|uniref:Uncharacterized protein n=1 Tax=Cuscuta epithymum TaxID=186058 RepID=A0AAV0EMV6_9ASTE|nr:unnamed protein product [Cuscuta epithymum]